MKYCRKCGIRKKYTNFPDGGDDWDLCYECTNPMIQEQILKEFDKEFYKWLNKYYVRTEESKNCPSEYFCIFDAGENGCSMEHILESKKEMFKWHKKQMELQRQQILEAVENIQGYIGFDAEDMREKIIEIIKNL